MLKDFLVLFQKGKEVANPEAWKKLQVEANLAALIIALLSVASSFGYDVPVSEETVKALSTGIVAAYALFNSVLTVITTARIGFKAKGKP
jgi:hypothetical protein